MSKAHLIMVRDVCNRLFSPHLLTIGAVGLCAAVDSTPVRIVLALFIGVHLWRMHRHTAALFEGDSFGQACALVDRARELADDTEWRIIRGFINLSEEEAAAFLVTLEHVGEAQKHND